MADLNMTDKIVAEMLPITGFVIRKLKLSMSRIQQAGYTVDVLRDLMLPPEDVTHGK